MTIRVVRDGKVGTVSTEPHRRRGPRDAAGARAAEAADGGRARPSVSRARAAAPSSPAVEGYDEETASLTPERPGRARLGGDRGRAGPRPLRLRHERGHRARRRLVDRALRLPDAHRRDRVALAADERASGYADATSWRAATSIPPAVARSAAEKAERTRGAGRDRARDVPRRARALRARRAPLVLRLQLARRARPSWRSAASSSGRHRRAALRRRGLRSWTTRATRAACPKAFDFEGVPKQRVAIVEDGRRARRRLGPAHGRAGGARVDGPRALGAGAGASARSRSTSRVARGEATKDELVESVEDGIYVTRLHYVNIVDAREGVFTGMTRDGTFLIEGRPDHEAARQPPLHDVVRRPRLARPRSHARAKARRTRATSTGSGIPTAPSSRRSRPRPSRSRAPARRRGSSGRGRRGRSARGSRPGRGRLPPRRRR